MFRASVVSSTAVLGMLASSLASAQTYCDDLAAAMEPGIPYAASCHDPRCITALNATDVTHLRSSQRTIVYKTPANTIQNSLVVVAMKYDKAVPDVNLPNTVALQRDAVAFVCSGSKAGPIPQTRTLNSSAYDSESYKMSLDQYQRYHIRGFLNGKDGAFLDTDFHVIYNNGVRCVASNQGVRRQQFLMYDRAGILSPISAFLARLFLGPRAAVAAPATFQKYDKLVIRVLAYQKAPDTSACLSFPLQAGAPGVDVTIDDLEQKASFVDTFAGIDPHDWQIQFDR